jgi:hypothetical protein
MSVRTTTSKIGPIKKDNSRVSRKVNPYSIDTFNEFIKTKAKIIPIKRSISVSVGKVMSDVTNYQVVASEYYKLNKQLDSLLEPRTSTGAISKKVPSSDALYELLWHTYLAANNLIINYSQPTDINFFQKREGVEIKDTDVLILFLNVHGTKSKVRDAELLGIPKDVNYCETSLTCHGDYRWANKASIEEQRLTCTRIAEKITCVGGFCSEYMNEIQSERDAILTSMRSHMNKDEGSEFRSFIKGVQSSCPTFVTSRCNMCVNNKRYVYNSESDPRSFNMIVVSDTSRNMDIGDSLLDYTRGKIKVTFTTQDIINQAYAIGYRNVGVISGACLNYTQVCSEEINTRAAELSRMSDVTTAMDRGKSLTNSFSVKRGGGRNKKNKRIIRRKNKTMKGKRRNKR